VAAVNSGAAGIDVCLRQAELAGTNLVSEPPLPEPIPPSWITPENVVPRLLLNRDSNLVLSYQKRATSFKTADSRAYS